MRSLSVLFALVVLASGAAVHAEPPAKPARPTLAVGGDLELRILPPEGEAEVAYVVRVGTPFALSYELKNQGTEPLLLPLASPHFVEAHLRYIDPSSRVFLGGRAWGPAPFRSSLTALAPGEAVVRTLELTPSLHGRARAELSLVCAHEGVMTHEVRTSELPGGEQRRIHRRVVEPEPRLWRGSLTLDVDVEVVFTSHFDFEVIEPACLNALWHDGAPLLEQLETLGRIAVLDPSSRSVDELRKGFGRVHDGYAQHPLVRLECAKQLAIAAKKGYGWQGVKTLLAVCGDDDEHEGVRLLALDGLAVALEDELIAREDDCVFQLQLPGAWREAARDLLTALAKEPTELGRRAGKLLEAHPPASEGP